MKTLTPPSRSGFTLPEALLVLVIVSVLAAILFAVFARVREKGRSSVCQSNLKQIALAMKQYVADSDGYFPLDIYVVNKGTPKAYSVSWDESILPYVKSKEIFWCPSSQKERKNNSTTYAYNFPELTNLVLSPKGLFFNERHANHETVLPATTGLAYDGSWFTLTTPRKYYDLGLHSNGLNLSFVDGHVKWYSMQQLDEIASGERAP